MTSPTPTVPHAADPEAGAGADELELPGWLYRSEAFAEDLLCSEVEPPRHTARAALSTALYMATLAMALLATLPSALPVA